MTLADLLKRFQAESALFLSGVDKGEFPTGAFGNTWNDDAANAIMFVVNGVGFCAVENPEDGYRSCLNDDIGVFPAELVRNRFPDVKVTVAHRTSGSFYGGGEADILELSDAGTGKVILAVGTDNTDDYYPSFVADWQPEHMSINAVVPLAFHHEDKDKNGVPRAAPWDAVGG